MLKLTLAGIVTLTAWIPAPTCDAGGPINRRLEAAAVVPTPGGPANTYDVHAIWTIEALGTSAGLNASTEVAVFVGSGAEVPSATAATSVLLDLTTAVCSPGNCDSGCGGGYINGVFNTMLCLEQAGCQAALCPCACRFPYITTTLSGVSIPQGASVLVTLFAAGGSFPESNQSDDSRSFIVKRPIFWDQSLHSVDLFPSVQPGQVDLKVTGASTWRLAGGAADMDFEIQVLINHVLVASSIVDSLAHPPGPGQSGCEGSPSICDNGCGAWNQAPVSCDLWVSYPSYLISCECGTPWIQGFLALPANPGDVVEVLLKPLTKSLPALPGSEFDDVLSLQIPDECLGDLDGNGVINGADVGILLAGWGGPGAGDLDGNGVINGGDLGLLLGGWGPCNPQ